MQLWEIDNIRNTFKRCYGLQHAINKAFEGIEQGSIINYQNECLKTLANQSGMRLEFITNHLETIKQL